MPNWRTIEETDLAANVSQSEIDTYRADGALDGSDPVRQLLVSTVDAVRGYISCNGSVRMGPSGTIPRGLVIPAMDYAMGKVLNRIGVPLSEDRREALRKAQELFEKIAKGEITPESYSEDGEIDESTRPATSPIADDGPRRTLGGGLWSIAAALLAVLSASAKTFDVDISTGKPAASNEAFYHGETIEFRAVRGRTVVTNIEYSCIFYQTNGMGQAWWKTDGLVFHPTNDCGAAAYRFFLEGRDEIGRDWHANGLLRFLPSPGFEPSAVQLPVQTLDFATITVLNPPWSDVSADLTPATNYTDEVADKLATSIAGKYPASSGEQLAQQVTAIGAHINGEDAKVMVTNYNSSTHLPEAEFDINVSNNWLVVWREMTRWNWFLGDVFDPHTNAVACALANKAEKEYAFFDGVTGEPAPDGFFWISQPRVAICAGAAYQRYVDTAGEVWVLESNGMVADINGTTNGYFRISDDKGNVQFEIVKGDSRTVTAAAGTMTRSSVMGVTHWHTTYMVTNAVSAPKAMFCRDIANPEWYAEDDPGCPCNVDWTHPSERIYVCEWWTQGDEPKMFMRSQYGQGSESRIVQNAPVEIQTIVIGGVKGTLGTATINGITVLTFTPGTP